VPSWTAVDRTGASSVRPQRVAELVASRLRDRILRGDLGDGDLLPKEDELRVEFPVSKPSMREALRILETEGLVTVRRGNQGGAVVHHPSAANAAYTLAIVLSGQRVTIADVAASLREVEPACAALCAGRADRAEAVVPVLRRLHDDALAAVEDLVTVTSLSRRFHETVVELCGNKTLILVVGALEALWSAHETAWAARTADPGTVPVDRRRDALAVHGEIIDRIAAGDGPGVRDLVTRHLGEVQRYPGPGSGDAVVEASALRSWARP
jgi:GntR family transcriptional regulator, transcriptional repressor for pyruvate dehydrogenase complex